MRDVFLRYPGGKSKALTFSYDDGCPTDVRLADIFFDRGMKATFNFTNNSKFTKEEIKENFLSKGHEIAVHGAYHRAPGNIRPIEGIIDVLDCRLKLEETTDLIIRGMAYPDTGITAFGNFGSYEAVKQYLKELDIAYARTLGGDNNLFLIPSDFYAWMPTAHHKNPKIFDYADEFINLDLSVKTYHARRYPRLFYIWGHSYEFDNDNNWQRIADICDKFKDNDDIWFATNIEIYDYITAYKSLHYSANGHKIYNPTLINLWIDVDGALFEIKSGETIII